MTFEVTLDNVDALIVTDYIKRTKMNLSEVAHQSTLEMIEDINYLSAKCEVALEEYKKNPVTISHAELMKKYGMA